MAESCSRWCTEAADRDMRNRDKDRREWREGAGKALSQRSSKRAASCCAARMDMERSEAQRKPCSCRREMEGEMEERMEGGIGEMGEMVEGERICWLGLGVSGTASTRQWTCRDERECDWWRRW